MLLLAWGGCTGGLYGALYDGWSSSIVAIVYFVMHAALIIQWVYLDAADHEFRLTRYFIPLVIICPGLLVVMPVYFVKSRGWIRGVLACGIGYGFLCLDVAITSGSTYLTYHLLGGAG